MSQICNIQPDSLDDAMINVLIIALFLWSGGTGVKVPASCCINSLYHVGNIPHLCVNVSVALCRTVKNFHSIFCYMYTYIQ